MNTSTPKGFSPSDNNSAYTLPTTPPKMFENFQVSFLEFLTANDVIPVEELLIYISIARS
jgi:hypothetical protein